MIEKPLKSQSPSCQNYPLSDDIQDPDYDWSFLTKPQALAKNRRIEIPRGKVLGGSSALNYMAYTRSAFRFF